MNIILDSYLYVKYSKKKKIKFITEKDLPKNNNLLSNKLNKKNETDKYLQIRKNSNDEKIMKLFSIRF